MGKMGLPEEEAQGGGLLWTRSEDLEDKLGTGWLQWRQGWGKIGQGREREKEVKEGKKKTNQASGTADNMRKAVSN